MARKKQRGLSVDAARVAEIARLQGCSFKKALADTLHLARVCGKEPRAMIHVRLSYEQEQAFKQG